MPNLIIDKTEDFAVRIVNSYKYLRYKKKELDMDITGWYKHRCKCRRGS